MTKERMRQYLVLAVLMFSPALKSGSAQNPFEPDTNIACVERLQMPGYSILARQAQAEGTITASVTLSQRASVELLTTEYISKTQKLIGLLMPLVENAIREATFHSYCGGKTVALVFDFKIGGRPSENPKQTIAFGYPNKFWIVAEPGKLAATTSPGTP